MGLSSPQHDLMTNTLDQPNNPTFQADPYNTVNRPYNNNAGHIFATRVSEASSESIQKSSFSSSDSEKNHRPTDNRPLLHF